MKLVATTFFTLLIGLLGVGLATFAHFPLPWMLGPLFATAIVNLSGVHPFGLRIGMPKYTNRVVIPIIALSISSGVTPSFLRHLLSWWPSLAVMIPFVILVQLFNYGTFRWLAGYDRATAYFSASPGGVAESVLLGEGRGGNPGKIVTQHSARVILAILVVPFILSVILDKDFELTAAVVARPELETIYYMETLALIVAAALGAYTALLLKLPAAVMLGPLVIGSLLYGTETLTMIVPDFVLHIAQIMLGTMLGCRLRREDRQDLLRSLPSAVAAFAISAVIAGLSAIGLAWLGLAPAPLLFLSFAPGGLSEMSLVAIAMGADPVFIAAHHLTRILATVFLSPLIFSIITARRN